jgi:hypothetical protein
MRLNPYAVTNPMHLLKCWAAALAFSFIVVVGEVFALHTPFGILAIVLGIPGVILNAIATGSQGNTDHIVYARLVLFGGIFYGLLFYLISILFRRISSKRPSSALHAKRN